MNDLKYAVRLLLKSPGFAAIAILTLALGIGVNSAIFSVIDAVMLRPLPYPEPSRLVSVWEAVLKDGPSTANTSGQSVGGNARGRYTVSPANLIDYNKEQRSFTGMAGFEVTGMNLTENGPPVRLQGEQITANYFSVLGIGPAQGRAFLPEEDRPGANHVAIVSDELWRTRFGADPNLIGTAITLEGEKYVVVGIMPPGFRSPSAFNMTGNLSFYVPAAYPASLLAAHGDHEINVLARLKPGVTVEAARADLASISNGLAQRYPQTNKNVKADAAILADDIVRGERTSLLVLLGAVGLILLIACANLANLLLVRAISRQREITIRFALGASRSRVVGELLIQSAVLAILGCAAGLAFGYWTHKLLIALSPGGLARLDSSAIDGRVMLFTLLLSLVTGIIFGLIPAWQASKSRPAEAMRASERNLAGSSVMRWRNLLMTAEIAVSMVLLVGAGLLLKSFVTLNQVPLGIATERVINMRIALPEVRYPTPERRNAFYEELADRASALPGIEAVAYANNFPMRGGWSSNFRPEEHQDSNDDADYQAVSPGYFSTLGITLQRGRLLTPADRAGAEMVAVVNIELARHFYPNEDPIGKRFRRHSQAPWAKIVGVVSDIRRSGKTGKINPQVYFPAAQTELYPVRLAEFSFRSASDPKKLVTAVQQQVWAIDKDLPVTNIHTYDEIISQSVAERRFQTMLLGLFASLALALAIVGIYGVISYSVSQRTAEIGIRMALGASRGGILKMVMGRAMFLAAIGIALGAAGAYGLSQYLKTMLFEVKPGDPATYVTLAVVLALVALAACFIPARRATKVDPMVALRYE